MTVPKVIERVPNGTFIGIDRPWSAAVAARRAHLVSGA